MKTRGFFYVILFLTLVLTACHQEDNDYLKGVKGVSRIDYKDETYGKIVLQRYAVDAEGRIANYYSEGLGNIPTSVKFNYGVSTIEMLTDTLDQSWEEDTYYVVERMTFFLWNGLIDKALGKRWIKENGKEREVSVHLQLSYDSEGRTLSSVLSYDEKKMYQMDYVWQGQLLTQVSLYNADQNDTTIYELTYDGTSNPRLNINLFDLLVSAYGMSPYVYVSGVVLSTGVRCAQLPASIKMTMDTETQTSTFHYESDDAGNVVEVKRVDSEQPENPITYTLYY